MKTALVLCWCECLCLWCVAGCLCCAHSMRCVAALDVVMWFVAVCHVLLHLCVLLAVARVVVVVLSRVCVLGVRVTVAACETLANLASSRHMHMHMHMHT